MNTTSTPNAANAPAARALRPRDAATLILVRGVSSGSPEILMGRRHARHAFMPEMYVFPGGRVDAADGRLRPARDLTATDARRLMTRMRAGSTPTRARALAMAAIRETWEETGLVVGRRRAKSDTVSASRHPGWRSYLERGAVPDLSGLRFIVRAITPPGRTRRFDTRFFLADAGDLLVDGATAALAPSGELEDVRWLSPEDARETPLPSITRIVLDVVEERLADGGAGPTPFFHFPRGQQRREMLP